MTNDNRPVITWNRDKLKRLKEQYETARQLGGDGFVFYDNGAPHELVTAYAKYLIEYLESKLKGDTT